MKKGKTSTGFDYEITDEALDNWELLEQFNEIDNGNIGRITAVAKELFSADQLQALKDHVKKLEGKVTISGMFKEIEEILNGEEKN